MAYELDDFVIDARVSLQRDPGPAGREEVRLGLERLLANPAFVARTCGDTIPAGLVVLYADPDLGFRVLAHNNDKARKSPPHDHGASWAIYGQAVLHTDMTEWGRNGDAALQATRSYRLSPGQAGIYQDGMIHSIDYPDNARFIRVTGTDLDRIPRSSFDAETGKQRKTAPQQAS